MSFFLLVPILGVETKRNRTKTPYRHFFWGEGGSPKEREGEREREREGGREGERERDTHTHTHTHVGNKKQHPRAPGLCRHLRLGLGLGRRRRRPGLALGQRRRLASTKACGRHVLRRPKWEKRGSKRLWMVAKSISHHSQTVGNYCLLVFTGES